MCGNGICVEIECLGEDCSCSELPTTRLGIVSNQRKNKHRKRKAKSLLFLYFLLKCYNIKIN